MFGSNCCCKPPAMCSLASKMKILSAPYGIRTAANCWQLSNILQYESQNVCERCRVLSGSVSVRLKYPFRSRPAAVDENFCFYEWSSIVIDESSGADIAACQMTLLVPSVIAAGTKVVFTFLDLLGRPNTVYELLVNTLAGYQNSDVWQFGPANIVSGNGEGCGNITWSLQADFNPLP